MLTDYVFITDNSCDLPQEYLDKHNIPFVQLSFSIDGTQYTGNEMPPKKFYDLVRSGKMPITAQVNQQTFRDIFLPYLEDGKDVLYAAFSSGLSGTCTSAQSAAQELQAEYPNRKVYVVDTLCASLGQGLLVHKANELREQGAGIDEVYEYLLENRLLVGHSFTVDDLMHLHRGGRLSKTSAIAGSLLGIKPVLHVDKEGRLVPTGKVRGRKQALIKMVDQLQSWVGNAKNNIFMLSHGDCLEDAEFVAKEVQKRFGIKEYLINYVGPVIGTHAGPGVVALFMMVESRA